jgi:hypothetical protein
MESLEDILDEMQNKRLNKEEFYLNKLERYQYVLRPTISLGAMQQSVNETIMDTDGIIVQMNLYETSNHCQEIQFLGSINKVHVLIFFTFLIGFIVSLFMLISFGNFTSLIIVSILWPIFHLWFNYVWTSQEKALIEEVKLALHIRIRARMNL